jgi:hypothetical protein
VSATVQAVVSILFAVILTTVLLHYAPILFALAPIGLFFIVARCWRRTPRRRFLSPLGLGDSTVAPVDLSAASLQEAYDSLGLRRPPSHQP